MEQEPSDVIILSAINQGAKKFDKISKKHIKEKLKNGF